MDDIVFIGWMLFWGGLALFLGIAIGYFAASTDAEKNLAALNAKLNELENRSKP